MNTEISSDYKKAILSFCKDADYLRLPTIQGSQKNIVLADVPGDTYVFKFADRKTVMHDEAVSREYIRHGIPVPQISAQYRAGHWFERYSLIPGRTLHECVADGMSPTDVRRTYREIVDYFFAMSTINPESWEQHSQNRLPYVVRTHVSSVNNRALGNVAMCATYLMNVGAPTDMGLYHSDISPKNVIIGRDGRLGGFVDIESVAVCNQNYAFATMAAKYDLMGYDIGELIDYYQHAYDRKLNSGRVAVMAGISNAAKKMLWRNAHRQH